MGMMTVVVVLMMGTQLKMNVLTKKKMMIKW